MCANTGHKLVTGRETELAQAKIAQARLVDAVEQSKESAKDVKAKLQISRKRPGKVEIKTLLLTDKLGEVLKQSVRSAMPAEEAWYLLADMSGNS